MQNKMIYKKEPAARFYRLGQTCPVGKRRGLFSEYLRNLFEKELIKKERQKLPLFKAAASPQSPLSLRRKA